MYKRIPKNKGSQEWAEIGGKKKYFRSKWERNYARYLELLKTHQQIKDWSHEPETFWFEGVSRGTNNYLPDYKVELLNGNFEYHEVKGYETAKDRTKYKRMAKYHPQIKLRVVGADWFKANNRKLRGIIKDWE